MADSDYAIANKAILKTGSTNFIGALTDDTPDAQLLSLVYADKRDELLRLFKWPWAQRRAYPTQLGGSTYVAATTYAQGAYVSYAPSSANVVNAPEKISTFVYLSLQGANTGHTPDTSPTYWRQISRAAWAYAFVLPVDVLQIHGLYHGVRNAREDQEVPYELGYEPAPGPGQILLTDAGLPWESLPATTTPVSIELEYTAQVTDTKQFPPDFTEALAWMLAVELCLGIRKDAEEAQRAFKAAETAISKAKVAALKGIRHDQPPIPTHIAARWTTTRRR